MKGGPLSIWQVVVERGVCYAVLRGASVTQGSSESGNEMSILVQEIDLPYQKDLNSEAESVVGKSVAPGSHEVRRGSGHES